MIGRKRLYGSAFAILLATVALKAEADRMRANLDETVILQAENDRWKPRREEIFRYVSEGNFPKAAERADELVSLTEETGFRADWVVALSIRGRVAQDSLSRHAFYQKAQAISREHLFESSLKENVSHLTYSHVMQDLGDSQMELGDKAAARKSYQAALDALSAFDITTYLAYGVSPDMRYAAPANEMRYIVGWLNLREGNMSDAESSFRLAEKGMLLSKGKVEDSVVLGLAVTAHFRGERALAADSLAQVEKRQRGARGLASAEILPASAALVKRARAYLKTSNVAELNW
ncbi:MAG: hypothetical protein EOP11_11460 [Proteobacteria bacterium]|nr:MAG: hypothetical protein EOP11_11460 [Pseudomonadota bacterium]